MNHTQDTPRPATPLPAAGAYEGLGAAVTGPVDSAPDELPQDHTQAILQATKQVGALLKASGYPFALVGSVAAYAHGVPTRLQHDSDFCLRRQDAEPVVQTLIEGGIQIVSPPEDWLVKARTGGEEIDLIFELAHRPVTKEMLDRAEVLPVDSVHMPVLAPTDLLESRLTALSEHHCDFGALLPVARALRERVDWDLLRREHASSPMPDAFLYLLERLDVIPPRETRQPPESGTSQEVPRERT
ncbi:nucleotidyltransferase family protein [Streptomyces peucetius]|uniref:Nucleotidyltransferase family protein n=1 Tax=Streptomyces peucetius TaxID=1950 RepID=A0ABY6I033_STRPE|nr:nucleotidyltransferase family protein [Streptomyces peucetius]UYQ60327.1 nucleotidyltransferase family protein [Streptomyces peucetius]